MRACVAGEGGGGPVPVQILNTGHFETPPALAPAGISEVGAGTAAQVAYRNQWVYTGSQGPHADTGIPAPGTANYDIVCGVTNPGTDANILSYAVFWAANSSNTFGAVVSDNRAFGVGPPGTYPEVANWWGPDFYPLTSMPHLYATWDQRMPQTSSVSAEAMFDMYFATVGNTTSTFELMVFVENHNVAHHNVSGGGNTAIAQNVLVNELYWDVWTWANGTTYGGYAFDLSDATQRQGLLRTATHFDMVPFINWMWSSGTITYANPTIQFCDFGWEIWSTSGQPMVFEVSSFSLSYT
jgi:hypothetical protein